MAKYQEVIGWITEQIDSGILQPGMKIPSENTLCERFGISRQTARHAIGRLEAKGILESRRGSGTYVTGISTKSLQRQKRIAVITTVVDSYIFPKTIQGIERKLTEYGYSMQIAFTNNTFERERSILTDILRSGDIAGMIVEPAKSALPNPNLDLYNRLLGQNIPILFINSYYPALNCPHVSLNDRECAKAAVKTLIDHGHKRIGCIVKLEDGEGHVRYSGYRQAMQEAGLPMSDDWVVWLDTDDFTHMSENREKILRRLKDCTAIFTYNDQVGSELLRMFKEDGIDVPERYSVVSMDDSDLATMNGLDLSSVPHPKEELGARAAENLIHLLNNKRFQASYEFTPAVNVRSSIADYRES